MSYSDAYDPLEGVAIIGLAGRFPGAANIEEFWANLQLGVESISHFSQEELSPSTPEDMAARRDANYVRARGILEDIEFFDAGFFGMNPMETAVTDPQHRLFLEASWEALENAGYDPQTVQGAIGVYAGMSNNTYFLNNVYGHHNLIQSVGALQVMMGNEKDYLATRVSYKLNLRGPSLNIYTACSTSLVAVCQAFAGLTTYQCDMALAGGVSITLPQKRGYLYQEGAITSPDGHCRPFDVEARGTVFSNGLGIVVLKRLREALDDGDTIYAVMKGAAVNNDGSMRVSFTAPSVNGQAEVIGMAQALAGIDPETVSYVEAHGTATPLGDPIEIAGLTQAFRTGTDAKGFCAIGSLKSNIGHLDAAAGVAGLIKTVLALKFKQLPPTLHFTTPNPNLGLENSPFFINNKLTEWKRGATPNRAGVSSFGAGGTNAHVVVEEAPERTQSGLSRQQQLLVLSAKTDNALNAMTSNLATYLEKHPELDLPDVAFTLQRGRKPFACRRSLVASNTTEALSLLRSPEAKSVFTSKAMVKEPSIVFLFPGQGAQYVEMGRELYEGEPVFRQAVGHCSEILQEHLGLDLRGVIYPNAGERTSAETQINQTRITQPAIFVVEYALTLLWMSWGVKPAALMGHSIGEYVAAVIAEAFTLEDALAQLAVRARLMQALPGGSMLAVRLGSEKVEPLLPEGASIAAVNSPVLCTVSGPNEVIREFQQLLESKDIVARALRTSHAFHSPMMDSMLSEFATFAQQMTSRPPKIPWVSTCTGVWMNPHQPVEGDYWVRQIRQTVRFADALGTIIEDPKNILLEVGPGQTLSQLARQHAKKPAEKMIIPSMGPVGKDGQDLSSMLSALGRLWAAAVPVDWEGFSKTEQRRRVPLPTYPFERKRYWIEPALAEAPLSQFGAAPAQPPIEIEQPKESEMQTAPVLITTAVAPRKGCLINELRDLFQSYSGDDHSQTDDKTSFIDMGFDSLFLTQISQGVLKRFGVKVAFRQMLEDLCTLDNLASFLDEKLPPEVLPQPVSAAPTPAAPAQSKTGFAPGPLPILPGAGGSLVETVIQQQMAVMTQQLELLRQAGFNSGMPSITALPGTRAGAARPEPVVTAVNLETQSRFGPFKAIEKGPTGGLTTRQQEALGTLITRYNRRTAKSKELAQKHRARFCDPRAAGNFRQLWKEMAYPIVCTKSKGSRIWDIDGNEYIDVTMGFGADYLGHSPDYVIQALEAQMKQGVEIGPQSPIAGEVAEMICEFTGMDRATFCNTGSEAVMAAIRVSRTVTGREKIVYFYGDYHGIFDEVLGRPALFDGVPGAMPIAPGIPPLANTIILEYGHPSSLEVIRLQAGDIAAVIVEPVQARHPDLQPKEFLKDLRRLTEEKEIALIFDEVITGFRVSPGGAQEYFGIKADLATYGKVVGGGMPIGVLAGSNTYMDALDGGFWQYGDGSSPPTGVTFFAGTFVRHPLAMAAAHAVLKHLKAAGPSLQEQTNQRTARFVERVNDFLQARQLPMRLQSFSAIFFYDFHSDLKYANLLFYYLRDRGIHIWEGRVGTLSVAHTDQDMDRVQEAFQESIEEMQSGGFLPGSSNGPSNTEKIGTLSPEHTDTTQVRLTEAQREIWLASRLGDTASCAFNESTVLHLRGSLDLSAMEEALRGLVRRYEALKTTFDVSGDCQIINTSASFDFSVFDYSILAESHRQKSLADILEAEARKPFDLEQGPLFRAKIIKISNEYHLLVSTAHHIVCDGWSFDVMMTDLSKAYNILKEGRSDDRPLPSMQISDYALWQEKAKDSPEVRSAEEYWVQQFADSVPILELQGDRSRPPVKSYRGARETKILDESIYAQIKKVGAKQGATLFSTLLSVYVVLLHRLTGQEDMVVGILAAGQSIVDSHDLVGHCTNLLPLHVRISGQETFKELLANVKNLVLDAYDNQVVTFGSLINKLKLIRDPSRTPLVSVLFNIDPAIHGMEFHGLEIEYVSNPRCAFQFDMGFNLTAYDKKLISECDYTTDLFDAATINRWLGHYHILIANIVADPNQHLSELPILTNPELHQLLVEWNATEEAYPTDKTLGQLFEEQVARTPDAVAVNCKGIELTFGGLNSRVNQLASYLRTLNVGPDVFVGICIERSIDMVVVLLGVLKAGGAYVPLDPGFPKDRLQFMLEDSGAPVLITQTALAEDLSGYQGKVVCIDSDWARIENESPENPGTIGTPENLAYMIYTSGSTGRPKGVQIPHRAVVNFLYSMRRQPGLSAEDTILSVTTVSFDIFGLELFLPLITGAKVVLAGWDDAIDGVRLIEILRESGASVMQATPATWRLLLQAGWEGEPSLRIFCGGEALPRDLVGPLLDRCKEFWNLYGPTETTIWSTVHQIKSKDDPVLIGHPIANTQIYILDNTLQPVPIGVAGELHIGGDGLARSYWNNPELTAEKFIPHPFNKDSNARIYKTGDLARYRLDGSIECLGRIDHQVKVRGFRIELGEIETLLNQNPSIKQSAVVTKPDPLGENQLVAYIVPKNDEKPDVRDLRKYLRETLPEYMVPTSFSFLQTMPMTPNGKVDRKALPATSDQREDDLASSFVAATDPLEMQLTKIWESVLGVKPIGIGDNFFEIGGYSLLAARLFSRINKLMGLNLPLAILFEAPTIELLAKIIRGKDRSASWSCLVPIQPGGSKPPLFFVHGAGGNVLLYRDLAAHLGVDQPFYGLQAQGLDDQQPHFTCFEDMAAHYVNEIRSFQPDGPYFLGGYCLGGTLALEMAQQLFAQDQEVALLAMVETYNLRAKTKGLPFYYDYLHKLQNLKFHWDNLRLLSMRDQMVFLSKKSGVSFGRMKLMLSIAYSAIAQKLRIPLAEKYPHINFTRINDQANLEYLPKPYKGKITLFRPKNHFAELQEHDFGWGGVAQGGVEVHVLQVNPRGTLVEPFVREIARDLKHCMTIAIEGTD